jgi:hypothetical protein
MGSAKVAGKELGWLYHSLVSKRILRVLSIE